MPATGHGARGAQGENVCIEQEHRGGGSCVIDLDAHQLLVEEHSYGHIGGVGIKNICC